MYSGPLYPPPFEPDPALMRHSAQREEYSRALRERKQNSIPPHSSVIQDEEKQPQNLEKLLEMISPEDSALVALIVFLLCDNTNNDVVLLGILLYVLLSK